MQDKKLYTALLLALIYLSCVNTPTPVKNTDPKEFVALGDSISTQVQAVLLKNVSEALGKGGPVYAIDYCNVNAIPLTDSMSKAYHVEIQRLSDKNRNPVNAIISDSDQKAWSKIQSDKETFAELNETGEVLYYKPIFTGMPACMKCHGSEQDIASDALELLGEKYPEDKATGYRMGDLRGMWKIKFNKTTN
ncbi:MAG TPA: DUF3365 domain-containing protein [Saprospiraceae bacterium]|nr:DUF3365 domain-containing protein [Saprospiraceae bacterium]